MRVVASDGRRQSRDAVPTKEARAFAEESFVSGDSTGETSASPVSRSEAASYS